MASGSIVLRCAANTAGEIASCDPVRCKQDSQSGRLDSAGETAAMLKRPPQTCAKLAVDPHSSNHSASDLGWSARARALPRTQRSSCIRPDCCIARGIREQYPPDAGVTGRATASVRGRTAASCRTHSSGPRRSDLSFRVKAITRL